MTIEICVGVDPDGAVLGERASGRQRNPSARHEALLELMKLFPETPLRLIAAELQVGYSVTGPLEARVGDPDAHGLRIDARLEYYGPDRPEPLVALIVEVQLSREADLRWRLCPYLGFVSHDCRCATGIIILCGTRELARKLSEPVMLGTRGTMITPLAIGPDQVPVVTSLADAAADPGLLVLSAWYHARRRSKARELLVELLVQVTGLLYEIDEEKAKRYHELALAILPDASARRLREMTYADIREYVAKRYYPDIWDPAYNQGREAGLAEAILTLLSRRDISVAASIRKQILGCHDSGQLSTWFERAITASTAGEVIA